MYTNSFLAVFGALLSVVAAIPMADHGHHHHHQRDYLWISETEVVTKTVAVTKTVWLDAGAPTPEVKPVNYGGSSSAEESTAAADTPPAPAASSPSLSSSTSVYVAPVPTAPTSLDVAPSTFVAPTTPAAPSTYVEPTTPAAPSTYVEPTTNAAPPPAAEPTTKAAPPAVATPAPAPAPSPPSSGGSSSGLSGMAASGTSYTGDFTWYEVGLGSCGLTSSNGEAVVAISHAIFDAYSNGNPNLNPVCGTYVSMTGADGQQHRAKIVDRCAGCAEGDLDLAMDLFNDVTANGDGRIGGMEWQFV